MAGTVTVETIELGDGSTVRAEVIGDVTFEHGADGADFGDVGMRERAAQVGSAVALTLDEVRNTVRGIGRWAAESITQGEAGGPDAFEVEFGLKLAVKSGKLLGVIAEAGSEAGLTIRLSWDVAARRARAAEAAAGAGAASGAAPGTASGAASGAASSAAE